MRGFSLRWVCSETSFCVECVCRSCPQPEGCTDSSANVRSCLLAAQAAMDPKEAKMKEAIAKMAKAQADMNSMVRGRVIAARVTL